MLISRLYLGGVQRVILGLLCRGLRTGDLYRAKKFICNFSRILVMKTLLQIFTSLSSGVEVLETGGSGCNIYLFYVPILVFITNQANLAEKPVSTNSVDIWLILFYYKHLWGLRCCEWTPHFRFFLLGRKENFFRVK
jgi:hypothetical protein